jgi:protein-S-isoprenylcysteine O-methyltransferase Ste14
LTAGLLRHIILSNQNLEFFMSNNHFAPKRFVRWFLVNLVIAAVIFAISGRYQDPWLWAYIATIALVGLYPALRLDDDLAKERFRPPEPSADRYPLAAVRLIALGHILVSCLDQRWQITHVPDLVRVMGLVGVATGIGLFFRAMMTNRFFSAVIRIQKDRGHQVIDKGLYAVVRHPGYAGMLPSMLFSALALGSWLGFGLGVIFSVLVVRRVLFEDAFLRANLQGYKEYAARVRYRLVPGVW